MKSNLVAIISRLEAMAETGENEVQTRRFEHEGELRCEVTYHADEQTFTLHETKSNYTSTFDDIDMVAIEIFDLLF